MRWLRGTCPHVEHHAYPSIPFHALPKLNRIVDDQIVPGAGLSRRDAGDVGVVPPRANERGRRRQRLLIISRVSTRLRACAGEIGLIPKM